MLRKQQTLQIQQDELKLDLELAKAKAREHVFAENERSSTDGMNSYYSKQVKVMQQDRICTSQEPGVHPTTPETESTAHRTPARITTHTSTPATGSYSKLNRNAQPFIPNVLQQDNTASYPTEQHLVSTNMLISALSLPQPEVTKFEGDILNFSSFITAFDSRVAARVQSSADKLYYLDQHLVGECKELISGCFHMEPDSGYVQARNLLTKEYGDPYKLSMEYINKIHDWPVVKAEDNVGIKKLSLFLIKCKHAMQSLCYLDVLSHPPTMLSIVQKLPVYLQNKWRDQASKLRRVQQKIVNYEDLVEFVETAADTANDPVYGKYSTVRQTTQRANEASAWTPR